MSHHDLAAVWSTLQGRWDIDNIAQELVGQYSLEASKHRTDRKEARSSAFRHIIALRAICDLQRTYLLSSDLSLESKGCLLDPKLLLSILSHLLEIKASLFSARDGLPDHQAHCSYIGQTFLSGLRALLLHTNKPPRKDCNAFFLRFEDVWTSETLQDVDHFSIKLLCNRMLSELVKEPGTSLYGLAACGAVQLPDFHGGLYPVKEIVIEATRDAADLRKSSDWFCASLVLYDIFSYLTAASIQFCMDLQTKKESGLWSSIDENTRQSNVRSILLPYFKIMDLLYLEPNMPASFDHSVLAQQQIKTLLCMSLHPQCVQIKCTCLDGDSSGVQDLYLRRGGQGFPEIIRKQLNQFQYLDTSIILKGIQQTLDARNALVPDLNKELKIIARQLIMCSEEWRSWRNGVENDSLSKLSQHVQGRLKLRRNVKGLDETPPVSVHSSPQSNSSSPHIHGSQLHRRNHLLPTRNLQSVVEGSHKDHLEKIARMQRISSVTIQDGGMIRGDSRSLHKVASVATTLSNSTNSTYPDDYSRPSTRTYSPIPHSSITQIQPPGELPTQEECTTFPEVVSTMNLSKPGSNTPLSIRSRESRHSHRNSVSNKPWSIFKGNRGVSRISGTPTAAFFTSGKRLLLWNDLGAIYYELENMQSINAKLITAGDIQIAAGGTTKSAVVAKFGSTMMLQIFMHSDETPVYEMEQEEVPRRMAISSNDHYVALKFGNYVRIVDTLSGATYHHPLPSQNGHCGPNDHLISFSTDCLSFVASTRFEPEKVVTYFCDCQNPLNGRIAESAAPSGLVGDHGLSSVVYSNSSAFLTTFTEKGYPVFLSLSARGASTRPLRDKNQQVGSRIHRAALSSTAQNLVLINDRNEIYWIHNPFGKEYPPSRVATIKRAKSVRRDVEIAIPGSDEVHVFWIEKGKGILVTVGKAGGRSKPRELSIDMEELIDSQQ